MFNLAGTAIVTGGRGIGLACDASSLMTGAVVLVDGGYTCW